MSILASGAVSPKEAVEYVTGFRNIRSIVFGASSKNHIEQTCGIDCGGQRMKDDAALKRVWDARDKISQKCDYDVSKLIAYYKEKQKKHKNRLVGRQSMGKQ